MATPESSSPPPVSRLRASGQVLPGFEETPASATWGRPFYFVQAADTQLGLIEVFGDGDVGKKYPDVGWEREMELCNQTVDILNQLDPPPAFFIVCGDLGEEYLLL